METLVLDPGYTPVGRISWQRAIVLLWQNKVEIVESYVDRVVRSVLTEMQMPAVVRFIRTITRRKKAIKFSRENIYLRDNYQCQYCGKKKPLNELTYDHVIPRVKGGQTRWDNIVCACVGCNTYKGGRTPQEAGMPLRTTPRRPDKLTNTMRSSFAWRSGMPTEWKQFLVDFAYWNDTLDSDE